MQELNNYLRENFGTSVSKLVVMLVIGMSLYFGLEIKLNAVTYDVKQALSENAKVTLELKETNKELAKLREALVEVRTELRTDRRERNR